LFHAAQYGLPNKNKNVFHQVSGSDSRWLVEGTARWFEDFMYDNDDAYKLHNTLDPDLGFAASIFAPSTKKGRSVPPIFQPGLAKTEIPGLEFVSRGAKTSNFWKLLNSKCEGFVNNFNVLFSSFGEMAGGTVVEQAGMTGVLKILENSGCNFGEHMGEDKVSSLESAMAFYQYATQSEHKISLLDENEVDNSPTETKPTSYRFEQPRMFSAENWRGRIFDEDEFLPNRLFLELGIDSCPAYSAVSINVSDALDRVLEYQKEIQRSDFRFIRSMEGVLKIRTKDEKPLQVSLLVDNDNFKTGKEGFLLNGQPHFGYDSTEMCNDEFVFPITPRLSTSQLGDLFITITNPTGEIIDLSKAELQIRDTRPFRDNKRNVVIDRRDQRMFTDTIESVNSTFTHAEAVEYCAQEHAGYNDWQLPGAQTLAGYAWNHANEPFFENHLPEKEYWARGTDGDLGGVVRITPLTIRLTDLSFKKHVRKKHVRCVRVDTSVCGIDQ